MLRWYWSWFWLCIATSDSHTRLTWSLSNLPPLFSNVEYCLQKYTTGHPWDLRLIIWQLAEVPMRASPHWKHRTPTWISCWHLKIVHMCVCKHRYTISYIMLPIYTVGDIHSLSEHIIFPKHGKVYDLNLYREENTSEPLILIRKWLPIF